jgi:hypothetical protein
LNLVLTQWKEEIDKGKVVIGLFLDLKRAFESIDHNLLLENRMQRTCFNRKHSQFRSINLGVPQGSVLGPLMFIIYMNDIGSAIKECDNYLFADDTLLSVLRTRRLNRDLENLSKWLKFNKLKLNGSKTKFIIMTGRRSNIENGSTSLIIDGEQIVRVTTMKYLGIGYQNGQNNDIQQQHLTTSGLLFLDSISRKRRILEPHAYHTKQSNENNFEVLPADSC